MQIKRLNSNDADFFLKMRKLFIRVQEVDFDNPLSELEAKKFLEDEKFMVLAAMSVDQLLGGLIAHVVPNYYKGGRDLFIYDIAIDEAHQRQGHGMALLDYCKNFCIANGFKEMYVSAEADDLEANNFYRKSQGEELAAIYYFYKFD